MSDTKTELESKTEIELLKERANKLGLKFNSTIGVDKLKEKINAALNDDKPEDSEPDTEKEDDVLTEGQRRAAMRQEAAKLVRIRVNCMNPNKKEWEGELFTVSNSVVGSFKKYIPFNNEDGWHVPQIIYNLMKERECQIFYTAKDAKGNKSRKGKLIKEFAIDTLPDLTKDELEDLAKKQAMANAID